MSNYIFSEKQVYVHKVLDADLVEAILDVGFGVSVTKSFRLARIQTPSIRSKNIEEKRKAIEARDYLKHLLEGATKTKAVTYKTGNRNTYLIDLWCDGDNVSNRMLEEKVATAYKPKRRKK